MEKEVFSFSDCKDFRDMDFHSDRKPFLIILFIIGALIFLSNLGGRDLWEPDETRYAVVAREMKETGNWILPHLNGAIYAEKPPLFFWLVNLSTFFFGDSELANRLPSALAGLITMLLTFFFGKRLFNARVGFLSSLVLATCLLFPQFSRWMMLDSLFTLLFLLTLFCFYIGCERKEGRRKYFLLGGLFIGLGVLTKGPIAYLPIPIFLIFAFFQRCMKKFWNRDLLLGFLLSLSVIFVWLIPACWMGGEAYANKIIFGQTIARLAGGMKHSHDEPFFFYFIRFPIEFLPWFVFTPIAFIYGLRKGVEKRNEFLFLSIWFILIFLFFTLSTGKKDNYILPLYPAAALMVGVFWDLVLQSPKRERSIILSLIVLTSLVSIALGVFLSGVPHRLYPFLEPYHLPVLFTLFYLLIGISLSLLFFLKKMKWSSFISLGITFAVFHLHFSWMLPTKFNAQRSMKTFSEGVLKRMEAGDEIKSCFFQSDGLLYYTQRPFIEAIWSKGRFNEVMHSSQKVLLVIQKGDLDRIKRDLSFEGFPLEETRVGHWDLVLVSNKDTQKGSKKK